MGYFKLLAWVYAIIVGLVFFVVFTDISLIIILIAFVVWVYWLIWKFLKWGFKRIFGKKEEDWRFE